MSTRLWQVLILIGTVLFWVGVIVLLYHVLGLKVLDINGRYD